MSTVPAAPQSIPRPTFTEALGVWVKIGLLSFGGPTGQIALMHQELVEKRRWIGDARFLHALNYCMLLPGPEAQQLSIYIGWLLHRTWGGVVAGTLFVLPGAFLLWTISWVYVTYGELPWLAAIFHGLKPAVMGIVAMAVLRIGKKALKNGVMWSIAAGAFAGIFFLKLPFPLIVGGAVLTGFAGGRFAPDRFLVIKGHADDTAGGTAIDEATLAGRRPPAAGRALLTAAFWAVLWITPVVLAGAWLGQDHTLFKEGIFFSKAALVTVGGAYAVLPYVSQQAVETYHWLTTSQMLDGLGLAETTPGPLILVLQFVGFLGAWSHPEPLSPLAAATLGAGMTTWCTFLPGFLFIFVGAPYIEALRGWRLLSCALSALTAAVVGVVLNLSVWFALGTLFPAGGDVDWFAAIVATGVFLGLKYFNWDVVRVVLVCGALGWMHGLAAG